MIMSLRFARTPLVLLCTLQPKPYLDARFRPYCHASCRHFLNLCFEALAKSIALHKFSIFLHARHSYDETDKPSFRELGCWYGK